MTQSRISRRRFLKMGCISVTAAGMAACGLTMVTPGPPPVDLQSISYGEEIMNNRVLVAYATYAGSTVDVAAEIGNTLGVRGLSVDVKPIKDEPQVDGYRAVVIGSAVQYAQWLPEAVGFVKKNQEALNRVPVALFCVHIQNLGDDEASQRNRLAYLNEVRSLLRPVAEGFFAGRFDRRGAALLLPGLLARIVPPIDFRNWEKIRAWAGDITPLLLQQTRQASRKVRTN